RPLSRRRRLRPRPVPRLSAADDAGWAAHSRPCPASESLPQLRSRPHGLDHGVRHRADRRRSDDGSHAGARPRRVDRPTLTKGEHLMIQAKKLGHIVLNVRDAARSRDFYTRTLGLRVSHENLAQGAVFLSFGREHHELALFQMATGEAPDATQPGLHHMAWQLGSFDELQAAYRELKAMEIAVESTIEHNVTRSVDFR